MNANKRTTLSLQKDQKRYTQREMIIIDKSFELILNHIKETKCKPPPEFKEACINIVMETMNSIDANLEFAKKDDAKENERECKRQSDCSEEF